MSTEQSRKEKKTNQDDDQGSYTLNKNNENVSSRRRAKST